MYGSALNARVQQASRYVCLERRDDALNVIEVRLVWNDGKMIYPSFCGMHGKDAVHSPTPISDHSHFVRSFVEGLHRHDFVPLVTNFGLGLDWANAHAVCDQVVDDEHHCLIASDAEVKRDDIREHELPWVQVPHLPSGCILLQRRIAECMCMHLTVCQRQAWQGNLVPQGLDECRQAMSVFIEHALVDWLVGVVAQLTVRVGPPFFFFGITLVVPSSLGHIRAPAGYFTRRH